MEDLNPTARALLGVLSFGPQSGYDIKAFVDSSIRFFWAASYGSIYPELKRLEAMGPDRRDRRRDRRPQAHRLRADRRRHARGCAQWVTADDALPTSCATRAC